MVTKSGGRPDKFCIVLPMMFFRLQRLCTELGNHCGSFFFSSLKTTKNITRKFSFLFKVLKHRGTPKTPLTVEGNFTFYVPIFGFFFLQTTELYLSYIDIFSQLLLRVFCDCLTTLCDITCKS